LEVDDLKNGKWKLTGFYSFPEGCRKRDSWNLLHQLSTLSNLPCCIIRDFNDILSATEKRGRVDRDLCLIQGFRQAVIDAGIIDIHVEGYNFTWFKGLGTNKQLRKNWIER